MSLLPELLMRRLESAFIAGFWLAVIFPVVLLVAFLIRGRSRRSRYLGDVAGAELPAASLGTAGTSEGASPASSLGTYLSDLYDDSQRAKHYALPFLLFWAVWVYGWYWSLIGLVTVLRPDDALWATLATTRAFVSVPAAAFVGSSVFTAMLVAARTVRGDLQPKAFTNFATRLSVGTILGWMLATLASLAIDSPRATLFVAMGAGLFPGSAILAIGRLWRRLVRPGDAESTALSLRTIQGIGDDEELRLWEEGITDVQHLATENLIRLMVNTHFPLERLIDWKDQAFLCIYAPQDLQLLRAQACRGAMDVLGLEAVYYGEERHAAIVLALAESLKKPAPVVERLIDTIYNDPRVHQLWGYLKKAYPTERAQPIVREQAQTRLPTDPVKQ